MTSLGITIMVFIILKATDTVNWSWWVTLIPLFVGLALGIIKVIVKRHTKKEDLEKALYEVFREVND